MSKFVFFTMLDIRRRESSLLISGIPYGSILSFTVLFSFVLFVFAFTFSCFTCVRCLTVG